MMGACTPIRKGWGETHMHVDRTFPTYLFCTPHQHRCPRRIHKDATAHSGEAIVSEAPWPVSRTMQAMPQEALVSLLALGVRCLLVQALTKVVRGSRLHVPTWHGFAVRQQCCCSRCRTPKDSTHGPTSVRAHAGPAGLTARARTCERRRAGSLAPRSASGPHALLATDCCDCRAGKSSIQRVVFQKMSPHETLFLESTIGLDIKFIANNSFVQFQIWDLAGEYDFNGELGSHGVTVGRCFQRWCVVLH